jgi:hypothetical protein
VAGSRIDRTRRRAHEVVLRSTAGLLFHVVSEVFRLQAQNDILTPGERAFLMKRYDVLNHVAHDLVKIADRMK